MPAVTVSEVALDAEKVEAPAAKQMRSEAWSSEVPPLKVFRLSEHAVIPARGSSGAAGYDLSAAHPVTIASRGKAIVPTDLSMAIPEGCYGRIAPRSSMAWKKHTDCGAGVVDSDYRGPVGVVLFNLGEEPVEIARGDRVAQLVLERIATPAVIEVTDAKQLEATVRGAGGFGSTGA
eukprot:CAMPEP_0170591830 /NCGR_PEP_ID=MMETSP0224-20130122/12610_1 /TAXON_ID=285029 /ORGANISM="Togula jolla, Strain CCCM 725" /LENGTH=176 /DNA_ID=CAMNT_0010915715 /DNA_START=30 /DNA_END=560 /DNA_ORIENTATION=+